MSGVTEVIVLRADQVLQLQVGSHDGRPTFAEYTHSELLSTLVRKERKTSSRKSKTVEAKVSRGVGLMCRAIISGQWSTGAAINRAQVLLNLTNTLKGLSDIELIGLSPKAKIGIQGVIDDLDTNHMREQRRELYLAFNRDIVR